MGTEQVQLTPDILLQVKDSIECYKEVFTTVTTVTFQCFLSGVEAGFERLENKADMEA